MKIDLEPATLEGMDRLDADTLVLFVAEDDRPPQGTTGLADWRLSGRLVRWMGQGVFSGVEGEKLLMPSMGRLPVARILGMGIGVIASLDAARIGKIGERVGKALAAAKIDSAACAVPGWPEGPVPLAEASAAFRQGLEKHFKGRLVLLGDLRALEELFPKARSDLESR